MHGSNDDFGSCPTNPVRNQFNLVCLVTCVKHSVVWIAKYDSKNCQKCRNKKLHLSLTMVLQLEQCPLWHISCRTLVVFYGTWLIDFQLQ